jgi:ABC-2 type transport system permease protein
MFLVIFTAINGNDHVHVNGGAVRFAQYYVPAIVSFGLISACYTNLAFTLCIRRENGILKRTRGTPLSPVDYLAGVVANVVVVAAILTVLTILLGVIAYGVTFPSRYVGLIVTILVGAFCFSAIGVLVSTFVPNEDAAPAIINFLLFPLLFISGTFGTIENNSTLGRIAAFFPIRHLLQEMVSVFNPFASGTGLDAVHLLVLLAWGLGALLISLRRFRWEPRAG